MWLSSYYDKHNIFINSNRHICHILQQQEDQQIQIQYNATIQLLL
jgi:hypothetical protein